MCARALLFIVLFTPAAVLAAPVHWSSAQGGNDHWYEFVCVPAGIDWSSARGAALAAGGDLATITSSAEQAFINEHAFDLGNAACWHDYGTVVPPHESGPWLGGAYVAEGGWTWLSLESFTYTNWYPGLSLVPSDQSSSHNNLFYAYGYGMCWHIPYVSGPNPNIVTGYVVEYATAPVPSATATWGQVKATYR